MTKLDLLTAVLRLLRWIIADRLNQAFGKWAGYEGMSRVLVIDDEASQRSAIARMIER